MAILPVTRELRRSIEADVQRLIAFTPISVQWLVSTPSAGRDTRLIRTVRLPWDVAREAAERVRRARESDQPLDTEHALLVVWGLFAQQMGLLKGLEEVPINQQGHLFFVSKVQLAPEIEINLKRIPRLSPG